MRQGLTRQREGLRASGQRLNLSGLSLNAQRKVLRSARNPAANKGANREKWFRRVRGWRLRCGGPVNWWF